MALEKATIVNTVTGEPVSVLFNPEEYTVSREVTYAQAAVPGLSAPLLQFVNGNAQSLDMELLVDTHEDHGAGSRAGGDVRELTSRIVDLMSIEPSTHAPPVLLFTWGSLSFTCVLQRATQRFLMFTPTGVPVRARLTVTFTEFRTADEEARDVKRETADHTSRRTVREGETISAIAADAYGDARAWRPIALHNGIDDVRALPAGLRLAVPPLPYRDPETGEVHAAR